MVYVYASRTGNVESLIGKLGIDAVRINDGSETVQESFVLFTYTDGYGDIPSEVESFLVSNGSNLKGVIASGDKSYGDAFAQSGDKISEQYHVPCLYKLENDGTDEDVKNILEILKTL